MDWGKGYFARGNRSLQTDLTEAWIYNRWMYYKYNCNKN